jgi:hypothetical protein
MHVPVCVAKCAARSVLLTQAGQEGLHTFVWTACGRLYSFGTCHKGQLGNHSRKILAPARGDELSPYLVGSPTRDDPAAGPSGYLEGLEVVAACSASIHSTVLTRCGRVFAFGCGSDGRMGVRQYMTVRFLPCAAMIVHPFPHPPTHPPTPRPPPPNTHPIPTPRKSLARPPVLFVLLVLVRTG